MLMILGMLLAKFSKLPKLNKFHIFSVLAKKSHSVFIYSVITLLIFFGGSKKTPHETEVGEILRVTN